MTIDERDVRPYLQIVARNELLTSILRIQILTLLPSEDDAFEKDRPTAAPSLSQAFSSAPIGNISAFSGVILTVCLLGRILEHLHRPATDENHADLNGAFWRRHRELESTLAKLSLELPEHLRLPTTSPDSNVIFLNMLLQTSVVCLHQAAILNAEKNKLPTSIIVDSRKRCIISAGEIGRAMRMMWNFDLSSVSQRPRCDQRQHILDSNHPFPADESIPCLLSLYRGSSICTVLEIEAKRPSNIGQFAASYGRHAFFQKEEPFHRVIFGYSRKRSRGNWDRSARSYHNQQRWPTVWRCTDRAAGGNFH